MFSAPRLQVALCDHRGPGGGREATPSHVVLAAHSPTPADRQTLPGTLQDQDHQQETQRGATQRTTGRR